MDKYFEISGRRIGPKYRPAIIAEIGINHGGDLDVAKTMVDAAYKSGLKIIKHQTHIPEEEITPLAKELKMCQSEDCNLYETLEKISLTEEQERELQKYVEDKGMIFISAPFSFAAVDRLERMNIPAYKISSTMMNNYPLLEYVASKRKPIILSTGMNDMESVRKAVKTIKKYHSEFALLHCTNIYPTPVDKLRLNSLKEFEENFPKAIIGLSDHSLNNFSSYAALTLGASIIEKHFTDRTDRTGPDIKWSMTPKEAEELLAFAKDINKMKEGKKEDVLEEEREVSQNLFNTVVTTRAIRKGSSLTKDDLTTKGPNQSGIPAEDLYKVVWKKAKRDFPPDYHLEWEDLA